MTYKIIRLHSYVPICIRCFSLAKFTVLGFGANAATAVMVAGLGIVDKQHKDRRVCKNKLLFNYPWNVLYL